MANAPATSFRDVPMNVMPFAIVSRLQPRFQIEEERGLIGVFRSKVDATAWSTEPRKGKIEHKRNTAECGDLARVDELVRDGTLELQRRIRRHLEEDAEDAVASGEVATPQPAFAACLRLGERLAPHLVLAPGLKYAAFTEEGVVGLVLQSLVTDRRLTCRFTPDGRKMMVLRISERMKTVQSTIAVDDGNVPRELAEWVIKRA